MAENLTSDNLSHKKIKPNPDGYFDMGEYAYKMRDFEDYKKMVFKDSTEDWLSEKPEKMVPENSMEWTMRHFHTVEHYLPNGYGTLSTSRKGDRNWKVKYEWEWKEKSIFGGLDGFFSPESRLLELGSGHGQVIQEIKERYANRDLEIVGVDYRYHRDRPEKSENNLVGGNFSDLPFKQDHFDRLLSVESFPCWLPSNKETIKRYFSEFTRVCKDGALWRGTWPVYSNSTEYEGGEPVMGMDELIQCYCEVGWEVVNLRGYYFVARLHKS